MKHKVIDFLKGGRVNDDWTIKLEWLEKMAKIPIEALLIFLTPEKEASGQPRLWRAGRKPRKWRAREARSQILCLSSSPVSS